MLVGMMTLGTVAQEGKFTVKGTFEGFQDSVIFQFDDVAAGETIAKQALAVTGKMLEFSCDLKDAALLYIFDNNGKWSRYTIPAIPGETLMFYQDDNHVIHLGGSQLYVDYDEAQQIINPIYQDLGENDKHQSGEYGPMSKEELEYYSKQYCDLVNAIEEAVLNYVKAHPDKDASAALMFQLDSKGMERAEAMLTERARNSTAANLYKAFRALFQQQQTN
jgi:hypothetical protein